MLKALFTFYYRGRERKESIPLKTAKARRLLEKSIGRCFIQHRRGDYRFFFPREDEGGPALEPATRCIPSFSSLLSRTRTLRRMDAGCVHLLVARSSQPCFFFFILFIFLFLSFLPFFSSRKVFSPSMISFSLSRC